MANDKRSLTFSRPLLVLCAGILAAALAAAALCQYLIVDSLHERSAQYGRALAGLAARQAMDATLNHDLVSLQVILSDIAANPDVANATIHDVENNLLVQAGQTPVARQGGGQRQQFFTAPITLANSIAGYVTVSLDLTNVARLQYQIYLLFALMAALLIALTLSALYFGRSWNTPLTAPRPAIPIFNAPPQPKAEPAPESPGVARAAFPRVELIVQFHNLRELAAQLDSKSFRSVSRQLEEHFKGILALYAGQLIQLDSSQARIAFANPERDLEAAFPALCSAKLMFALGSQDRQFAVHTSAMIVQRDSDSAILRNLQYQLAESEELNHLLRGAPEGALLMEARLATAEIAAKIQSRPVDDFADVLEVVALSEQYEALLASQLEQLSRRR